jgi:hypothetical protein
MIVTLRVQDLREIVRDVVAEALKVKAQTDLLDMKQALERYRVGRDAILAGARRGELELSRGPRRKLLVRAAELERWLTGRKYTPSQRPTARDMEEWGRQVRGRFADHQATPRSHREQLQADADAVIKRELASGRLRLMSREEQERARSTRKRSKPR